MSLEQPPSRGTPVLDQIRRLGVEIPTAPFSNYWSRWFTSVWNVLRVGVPSTTVVLFGPTTNGSLTIVNGLITKVIPPT